MMTMQHFIYTLGVATADATTSCAKADKPTSPTRQVGLEQTDASFTLSQASHVYLSIVMFDACASLLHSTGGSPVYSCRSYVHA